MNIPGIHFDWTITLGNVSVFAIVMWLLHQGRSLRRDFVWFMAEHDLLREIVADKEGWTMEQWRALVRERVIARQLKRAPRDA